MDVMKCHAIYTFKIETWTISQFSSLRQIQTNMKWRYRIQIWAWSVFDSTTNQSWKLIIRTSDIELPIPTTLNIKQLLWIRKVKSKRFATKHQLRINPRQQGAPKTQLLQLSVMNQSLHVEITVISTNRMCLKNPRPGVYSRYHGNHEQFQMMAFWWSMVSESKSDCWWNWRLFAASVRLIKLSRAQEYLSHRLKSISSEFRLKI